MSLRTRLIIAFLLLSVVPLSAVTFFSYTSAVNAFENAARREALESAQDIGRRMELITADVGRRMDRLFEETPVAARQPDMTQAAVRDRVAPTLGDTAALVDRVEFHPTPGNPALPPPPGAAPRPPLPPSIVVNVPELMEAVKKSTAAYTPADVKALIDKSLQDATPPTEDSLRAVAEALSQSDASAARAKQDMQMQVQGRRVEIAVKKGGKIVGKANATLNLERMMKTILAFARRDQGEIAFALDRNNVVYTPDRAHMPQLELLNVQRNALLAAEGRARRVGDWIIVARKDPGGLIFGIARPIGQSLREIRRASVRNLSLGLAAIGLAFVGIIPISHRMTRHLTSLTSGVRQLAAGDFRTRVPVKSRDEFGTLATAFNQMAEDLERNQALAVEQERLKRELELSRLIQTEMLPRHPLRLGTAEIKGVSIPAREVGGDFFNYFPLADGRLALLVGDVSGKGVSAALLMANVQATLRARLPHEMDLARLADALDREIDANTPRGVYLTLFLAILETDGRRLRYVNAGHNPQYVIRARGGIVPMSSTGLPIALYPEHGYSEASVNIERGDLIFFYTDGLVEAENEDGDMFGAERLQMVLSAEQGQNLDTILQRVEEAVHAFRGRTEPLDDATMMALRLDV